MVRSTGIVAYTYRADLYCSGCILGKVRRVPIGPRDAEDELGELASSAGIDRYGERTFDSCDFPKVVFRDQADRDDRCGSCGELLR
ncbi:MAG: hypothetical protein ACREQM_02710 [Candidatus Dormibacteraceae bacterium]